MKALRWVAAVLLVPAFAFADINTGNQTLTVNAGLSAPLSNIDFTNVGGGTSKFGAVGGAFGGQYLYYVTPRIGFGAEFSYSASGKEDSLSLIPRADTESSVQSALFQFLVRINLVPTGQAIPYFFGGFGFHSSTLKIDATPQAGFVWADTGTTEKRSIFDDTKTGAAGSVGMGLDYYYSDRVFLGFEGRVQFVGDATYDANSNVTATTGVAGVKGSFTSFNFLGKIGYRFGGTASVGPTEPTSVHVAAPEESKPAKETPPPVVAPAKPAGVNPDGAL